MKSRTRTETADVEKLTRALMDAGKIVEAGWVGLKLMAVPADASDTQIKEMRMAFFAGAQHLFSSIMSGLEEDHEPTDTDLKRMDLIHKELQHFATEFKTQRMQ